MLATLHVGYKVNVTWMTGHVARPNMHWENKMVYSLAVWQKQHVLHFGPIAPSKVSFVRITPQWESHTLKKISGAYNFLISLLYTNGTTENGWALCTWIQLISYHSDEDSNEICLVLAIVGWVLIALEGHPCCETRLNQVPHERQIRRGRAHHLWSCITSIASKYGVAHDIVLWVILNCKILEVKEICFDTIRPAQIVNSLISNRPNTRYLLHKSVCHTPSPFAK